MSKWNPDQLQQAIGFFAFLIAVLFVFWTSAVLLLHRLALKLLRKPAEPLARRHKIILSLAAFGVVCIAYGYLIEPYWLSVTNVQIASPKIHSTQPIRIVHISDLHCDPQARLEHKLVETIAGLRPDIIVFTGDAINSPPAIGLFRQTISALSKIAPTYAVKGNWDAWYFPEIDRFKDTGVVELTGAPQKVHINSDDIYITGLSIGINSTVANAVRTIPSDAYSVFLFHYPDYIEEMERNKVDLYLAGHTHGGQVALPFYGALVTLASTGKRYEAGLYQQGNTHLYVNRGIGMEGGIAPRVRFCARPEVTVITLTSSENSR